MKSLMWAICLATSAVAAEAGSASLRIIATDLVESLGATTGDGSPGGYYFRAGTGTNVSKYVVFLQGGGECRTKTDCKVWFRDPNKANSAAWPATTQLETGNVLDTDCASNPDFCTWSKIWLPYVTADMWSGTRKDACTELGGYHFSGHNILRGMVEDLKRDSIYAVPTQALITGSSAGGIGALTHTDFFADAWAPAVVKGAPECGFFYAGVQAHSDYKAGGSTPVTHLGFIPEWAPWFNQACSQATGGNMSLCTDAHFLYPHIKSPLFIRENLYDVAKLQNCGFAPHKDTDTQFLKDWGHWMRAELEEIAQNPKDGYFAPSCLQHGGNFGFETSPVLNGVTMRDAISNWFFEKGDVAMQHNTDTCGNLPCTVATGSQSCPHLDISPTPSPTPSPISDDCNAQLETNCHGLRGHSDDCRTCVRHHARGLKAHGCPQSPAPVFEYFCDSAVQELELTALGAGHHVCDLSPRAFEARFGKSTESVFV